MFEKRLLLVGRPWLLKGLASAGNLMNKGTTVPGKVRSWYQ